MSKNVQPEYGMRMFTDSEIANQFVENFVFSVVKREVEAFMRRNRILFTKTSIRIKNTMCHYIERPATRCFDIVVSYTLFNVKKQVTLREMLGASEGDINSPGVVVIYRIDRENEYRRAFFK
jgi:hypothetical protein